MALVKFDIPPRARRCCLGNEDFTQGMEYISLLEEKDDEGYLRKDYCLACWKTAGEAPGNPQIGEVHWKSQVPLKSRSDSKDMRRDVRALELLREILETGSEDEEGEAFVLALLLQRGKRLVLKQEIADQGKEPLLLFEVAGTEEMIPIKKISLSAIETEKLQHILARKLGSADGGDESVRKQDGKANL